MGNELKKKEKDGYLSIIEDALPDLMERNVRLQKRALAVIEDKIDECTAAQAATVYGILWDKCNMLMSKKSEQTTNNQMNMFICSGNDEESANLMEKVLVRMRQPKDKVDEDKVVQADIEIVD